jgi:hypothetical protein
MRASTSAHTQRGRVLVIGGKIVRTVVMPPSRGRPARAEAAAAADRAPELAYGALTADAMEAVTLNLQRTSRRTKEITHDGDEKRD